MSRRVVSSNGGLLRPPGLSPLYGGEVGRFEGSPRIGCCEYFIDIDSVLSSA